MSWNPRRRCEDCSSLRASIRDGRKTETSSRVVAWFSPLDVIYRIMTDRFSDLGIPAPQRHASRGPGPDCPLDSRSRSKRSAPAFSAVSQTKSAESPATMATQDSRTSTDFVPSLKTKRMYACAGSGGQPETRRVRGRRERGNERVVWR